MMKELLTAREVQDLLKVDRVTVYRMLKDGRLTGVKVGQQWRFEQDSVEALLSGNCAVEQSLPSRPADILPIHCVQPIQDVFAEVADVGAITVAPDGAPLTEASHTCRFCALLQSSPSGRLACQESWRRLSEAPAGAFATCHAGLSYAHAKIRLEGETVALVIAGQFDAEAPDPATSEAQIARLAAAHGLDPAELAAAAAEIPTLDARAHSRLAGWLERVAGTFETIARERANLLGRLRRIAEMTIVEPL
jgi:excisionase family DNA binding protein